MARTIAVLLGAYVFAVSGLAVATEEQRLALAQEILRLQDAEGNFQKVLTQTAAPLIEKVRATKPDKASDLERMLAKLVADTTSELLSDTAKLMTGALTEAELIKVRDFYKIHYAFFQTDVGRKMSEVMSPATNKAVLAINQKHMGKFFALVVMMMGGR